MSASVKIVLLTLAGIFLGTLMNPPTDQMRNAFKLLNVPMVCGMMSTATVMLGLFVNIHPKLAVPNLQTRYDFLKLTF